MKYDMLTPNERLQMVRPRIAGAERTLFQLELDEIANPMVDHSANIAEATAQLEVLKTMESELENEIANL